MDVDEGNVNLVSLTIDACGGTSVLFLLCRVIVDHGWKAVSYSRVLGVQLPKNTGALSPVWVPKTLEDLRKSPACFVLPLPVSAVLPYKWFTMQPHP